MNHRVGTVEREAADYWSTSIIDVAPGQLRLRGYPIEQLIGGISFVQVIWLMLRGEVPSPPQAELLEAALVASVDHGPHAPSIAIARMAATCGIGLNGAMASAMNVLGDVHGGAGQQAAEMFYDIDARTENGLALDDAVVQVLDGQAAYLSGFGHRVHKIDPRAVRLLALAEEASSKGVVPGRFVRIGRAVEAELARRKNKTIPMNVDGATAVVFCELGFAPELARGMFCISRGIGIMAHAWEQTGENRRIKGPMPRRFGFTYTGRDSRDLPTERTASDDR